MLFFVFANLKYTGLFTGVHFTVSDCFTSFLSMDMYMYVLHDQLLMICGDASTWPPRWMRKSKSNAFMCMEAGLYPQ